MRTLSRIAQSRRPAGPSSSGGRRLRLGFVPLFDSAPLIMARELGLFEANGLQVQLHREIGWATVREKLLYRELDAVHALAPMLFAASRGLGSVPIDCLTGLVLSVGGNAITLSAPLLRSGVRDGRGLREWSAGRNEPLVFGIPFLYSCHHFLLHAWLESSGFVPHRDVRLVVVPPPQMPGNLKAGHLDGFCAGEPWNSVATLARAGGRVAGSAQIAPGHPEKVLMVRREFAEARADEHAGLIRSLLEACRFCVAPENRGRLVETLARPGYLNVPEPALAACFEESGTAAPFDARVHEPTSAGAEWVLANLVKVGLLPPRSAAAAGPADLFRADLFQNATRTPFPHEPITSLP